LGFSLPETIAGAARRDVGQTGATEVTRDEIQKLIGGYATGSLTDAERKLLFDAALDDQELFDQLAHEQTLKELLEEPGVKQRLVAALSPENPSRVLWKNQWPWAIAAVTACLAVVVGIAVVRTSEKPREIAAVTRAGESPTPLVSAPQVARESVPPAAKTFSVPKTASRDESRQNVATGNANAPAPIVAPQSPPSPAATPAAEPSKLEKAAQPSVDAIQVVPAPPPPAINRFAPDGNPPEIQLGQIQIAPLRGAPSQAAGAGGGKGGGKGGGGGGRGGGGAGFVVGGQSAAARVAPIRFAFDYSFDAAGALRIVPAAQGYLSVTAPLQPVPSVLLPTRMVAPGPPIVVPVPPEASELIVSFSATPATVTGTPTRREEAAGTVEDPSQRILVTIPVKR
jgi:uncharacterized membrane protein YgcG